MKKNKLPMIVIFGRTNVGKSTLFNCLTEKNSALVSDIEGTTRDSNVGQVEWQGMTFDLVDTGGIIDLQFFKNTKAKLKDLKTINDIDFKVQQQAREFLKRADIILFLADTRAGLLAQDKDMALELKRLKIPTEKIILVANKADSPRLRKEVAEFNKLALNEPIAISATTGSGTGDLLDVVVEKIKNNGFKTTVEEIDPEKLINVCILGKPNVGKSSLVNSILGEDKIIVSPIPHTTREPQDTEIIYKDFTINLVDTAGISKKGRQDAKQKKLRNTMEKYSITKTLQTIQKADVALFVVDIHEGLTKQDSKIIDEIIKENCNLIIIANKWDLIENPDQKEYTESIYDTLPFVKWAPIQFVSAKTGKKVHKVLDLVIEIAENRKTEISANALTRLLHKIIKKHRPSKGKGTKHPHIFELAQIKSNPPQFMIRIGAKDNLHFSYVNYIENRLREKFGFIGTPISLYVKKNKRIHGMHEEKPNLSIPEEEDEKNKEKIIKE